jgi:hypothetical protein
MALINPTVNNFADSALATGLAEPNRDALVYYLDNGKSVINYFLSGISPNARQVDGFAGNIQKPLMAMQSAQAIIASVVQVSATMLTITFTDPNYTDFIPNMVILNNTSSNVQALITTAAPGTITVRAIGDGNTIAAASFPVGTYVSSNWNAQGYVADSQDPRYNIPTYVQNWTQKQRWSTVIYLDDNFKTYPKTSGGENWIHQQELLMVAWANRNMDAQMLMGSASGTDTIMGGRSTNMGLVESIKDPLRGGIVAGYSSVPTLSFLNEVIAQVKIRYGTPVVRLLAFAGTQFMFTFQNLIAPYVQASGIRNTFGVRDMMGLDAMFYRIAGIEVGFIIVPAMDDPYFFPNPTQMPGLQGTLMSNSCIIVDEGWYSTPDGKGMRPAMERIYFGQQEYIYKYLPGVVGFTGTDYSSMSNVAVTGKDQIGVEFQTDRGLDAIGYRMAWIFPTF